MSVSQPARSLSPKVIVTYRITKIKCPDKTYVDINHEEDEEDGWPEVEMVILQWLEYAAEHDMCLVPEFLSVIAKIPVDFAAERLDNLYENGLAFKSVDDGIAMFCFEDPDPDFDGDDPDGGEEFPIDLGGANNEEFYPLDTRKVANDMLKELAKMAGELDRLGFIKEADSVDMMIQKVASDQKASKKTYTNPKTGKKNTVRYGQKGAKVAPGTSKGDSYCARSNGIKKALPASKRNDPNTPNNLSRKKWRCSGDKSKK